MIKQWCESKGVTVFTGTRVDAIERDDSPVLKVRLSTGQLLEADLVISATGVRPNIGFLEDSRHPVPAGRAHRRAPADQRARHLRRRRLRRGLRQDQRQDHRQRHPAQRADQARVAALNMVGKRAELPGVTQINVLDTLGSSRPASASGTACPAASMWS
jgi:NADPH-dependent 2,4-dienoyl-CoA reductase/sulfur reductase-like enzyme